MKRLFLCALLSVICLAASPQGAKITEKNKETAPPHLQKQGTATRLIVNDQPFLVLGGELHNSSTSDVKFMQPIWKQMANKNLNTVIAPVSWELIEDQKGRFDFTLPDSIIAGARKHGLHVILLWFGSWKNSTSTYVPAWVKKNFHQYTHAADSSGKTLEILSTFSDATLEDEANAFSRLMTHIKAIDGKYQTVIMVQVENEAGILKASRDYSEIANKAYNSDIPRSLSNYLNKNKSMLAPELDSVWRTNGFKTYGNWETVFGKSRFNGSNWKYLSYYTQELFMAWHYAGYIGKIAAAGKKAYNIPMFVNAWQKQPDTAYPGKYPSGGPLPQVIDMWRAAAPSVDFIAPDIYMPQFVWACDRYHRLGNPLFIPETRGGELGAARAFYVFGSHDAIGFSPFGIDGDYLKDEALKKSYAVLNNLKDLILDNQGKQTMKGILLDTNASVQRFNLGGYQIEARLNDKSKSKMAGGIIINIAPDEYIVAAKSMDILFTPEAGGDFPLAGIDICEEGKFINHKWVAGRHLNGDEVNTAIISGTGLKFSAKAYSIQYLRLYRYQ